MRKILLVALSLAMMALDAGAECEIFVAVSKSPQTEDIPASTLDYLNARLTQMTTLDGFVADASMTPFVITAKFSHLYEETLPGPPMQTSVHTYLTLYAGDCDNQTVYASKTIELRGVGTSAQRAFISALRAVNDKNVAVRSFMADARAKILKFYDDNYQQIIEKARQAEAAHDYERALWIVSRIPECSSGYAQASGLASSLFRKYIDRQGDIYYNKAYAEWSSNPDAEGASRAFYFLSMIDPGSSAYGKAENLAKEIGRSVKSDRDFELRKKYEDAVDLERQRIRSARDVGVAYGEGQQPVTTNLNWIK